MRKVRRSPNVDKKHGRLTAWALIGLLIFGAYIEQFSIALSVLVICLAIQPLLVMLTNFLMEIALSSKIRRAAQQHLTPLIRSKYQLSRTDVYGEPVVDDWIKEVEYFVLKCVHPRLTKAEQIVLSKKMNKFKKIVDEEVALGERRQQTPRLIPKDMEPGEFERFCAEELQQAGWDARVTRRSRDQGVDVVAEKGRTRVILQCKLYTYPVGNRSVQEAAAGKAHEQADYGIVVTNSSYTPAAEQLAATNGILLLHYSDLPRLGEMLDKKAVDAASALRMRAGS